MPKVKFATALLITSTMLSGCVTGRYEIVYGKPCSSVIPKENLKPTPGAKIPNVGGETGWFGFGAEQTGQLDKANNRADNNLDIVRQCEEHDRSAVIVPKQKVIGIRLKK